MTTKTPATKTELRSADVELPLDQIIPDPNNRNVEAEAEAAGEEWQQFVDSIRIQGVVQRLEVCDRGDGQYDLIDGERRWRGAREAGREAAPVRIWPVGTSRAQLIELGLLINVQRREHGALEIARRLRELKNQYAMKTEEFAQRIGLPVDKVRQYLLLFEASDELLVYFQANAISLRVGAELVRFQKKHGEAATRRLLGADEPLTVAFVIAERKRLDAAAQAGPRKPSDTTKPSPLGRAVAAAVAKNSAAAAAEVQALLAPVGYLVVACGDAADLQQELDDFLRARGAQLVAGVAARPSEVPTRA